MSKLGPISHFLSLVSCDSLVLQGLRCEWVTGVLNLVLSLSLSHTGHWKFNMATHGKELSEDLKKNIVALHKDGIGQGFPNSFLEPPQHCTFCMYRLSITPDSTHQLISSNSKTWKVCVSKEVMQNVQCLGGSRNVFGNPWRRL